MTINFELKEFKIRPWQPGDELSLVENANNAQIWENLRDLFPYPYTLKDAQAWIRLTKKEKPRCNFAIEVDAKAVGGIGIALQQDVYRKSVEVGYWLGEKYWRRGIMTEAVQALTEYAFETFEICRVYAGIFEWNKASMRVLEKAGYECEGRLKKSVTKNGRTGDQFIYAIIK